MEYSGLHTSFHLLFCLYDDRERDIRRYNRTLQSKLQDDATRLTKSPCDWRRAIFLQAGPASAQSRLDIDLILFSLPASSFALQLPSDKQRERQVRLFRLTGKTLLVLLLSMPLSLHYGYTMSRRRRQALNVLEKGKCSTFLRKERIWRYKYHTQFSSYKAHGRYVGYYETVLSTENAREKKRKVRPCSCGFCVVVSLFFGEPSGVKKRQ
jgi:hypothetical protein